MFSKSCEYGIRAVIYIVSRSSEKERTSLKDIAEKINSPESFTAKILQQLAKAGIVNSVKGPTGGFMVDSDKLENIKLIDVVETLDGDTIFSGCGLGLKECDATKPCPLHHHFVNVRKDLKDMLQNTKMAELANDLTKGDAFLKR